MAQQSVQIQFPPGRIIMGNVYKGSDKDDKGQPRVVKSGPNKGQPFVQFFIGVAIPKAGEQAWWQTAWGQQIMAVGAAAFPNIYQNPTFAWKIEDGDSAVPNKKGRKPCDMEGARGHWIVKFSSGFPPKVFTQPQPNVYVEEKTEGLLKVGYWCVVSGSCSGNNSSDSPGVYLGHNMLLFFKADAEITQGPDAASAFAGAPVSQALPGAQAVPFAGAAPGVPGAVPGAPMMPGLPAPAAPVAMPAATQTPAAMQLPAAPAPVAVAPNPAFPGLPGAPAAPAMPMAPGVPMAPSMPAAPPAPVAPAMTPAGIATGHSYAAFRERGWSDDQMRQAGYIV